MTQFREGYCGFFDHPSEGRPESGICTLVNADGEITFTDQEITTTRWITVETPSAVDMEVRR